MKKILHLCPACSNILENIALSNENLETNIFRSEEDRYMVDSNPWPVSFRIPHFEGVTPINWISVI